MYTYEMRSLAKRLDKIVKLRKKYGSNDTCIPINENISIEFDPHTESCYICVNEKRTIEHIPLTNYAVAMVAFGTPNSYVKFVTSDKTIANQTFVRETSSLLKDSLDEIESRLKGRT